MCHAALGCKVSHAVNLAEPYDIFYIYVISDQILVIVVYVNDTNQTFSVQPKIIQETAVLSEFVYIRRVVDRRVVIAKENDQTAAQLFLQNLAPLNINVFVKKHVNLLVMSYKYLQIYSFYFEKCLSLYKNTPIYT